MSSSSDITITETRHGILVAAEKRLLAILAVYPELENGEKVTPTAKKYREAFKTFVARVDEVLSCKEIMGVFQMAAIHGFDYKGPSLAKDIVAAKKLLKL